MCLQLHAPASPTSMKARKPRIGQAEGAECSTIDRVLSSSVYVYPLTVRGGIGAGRTDLCPVLATIDLPRQATPKGNVFITSRYRLKTAISVDSRGRYCEEIPAFQGRFEAATNIDQFNKSVYRSARTGTPPVDAVRPTATAAIQTILGESYGENVKEEIAILQDCENYQCTLGMGGVATNTPSHPDTCEQDEDLAE
jgi:hypothetical protein